MPYPIGIDLGTTNSVAAVWQRGEVTTIPVEGRGTLPSAVAFRPEGTVVGRAAKAMAVVEPAITIASVKRVIGDGKTTWKVLGKTYTPVDVSAIVLRRLRDAAQEHLGQTVTEAVITVPAYFNNNQKQDTKRAGEAAGLRVLQLLPEPTAAAIDYGLDKGRDQTLLVYDLGGGTFDVSVVRVHRNEFNVVAVDGDFHLGGDDFDMLLVEHLVGLLERNAKIDVSGFRSLFRARNDPTASTPSREVLLACQRLKEVAEAAKIDLSESDTAQVSLPNILGGWLDEEITLETYDRLIAPIVDRTIEKTHSVLRAAKLRPSDVDRVILVGGSTRNRLVKQRVAEAVKEPWTSDRVDEVVARGAAIVASSMAAPVEDLTPAEIEFRNVTPFSLGVRASRAADQDLFEPLIAKNTPVSAQAERDFTTYRKNQSSVEIAVFQGEDAHCRANTFVGGFRLEGIPPAPAGQPRIDVRFSLDNSDLLTVEASCSNLRSVKTLDVNRVSREEDLKRQAVEADIMFLIDTSGSMSLELDGVKTSSLAFADKVIEAGVSCQLGLMDFDLPTTGDRYNWEVFGPMAPSQFPAAIAGLRIGRLGGVGCYIGNANTVPVIQAFADSFPGADHLRIGILISDEVGNDAAAVRQITEILRNAWVTLHVLGVANSCHEALASQTGGRFWDIQASRGRVDFSDLLDSIAGEITNLALR